MTHNNNNLKKSGTERGVKVGGGGKGRGEVGDVLNPNNTI